LAAGGELPVDLIGKGGFPFNDSPGINFILEQREFVRHLLSSFGVVPRVWVCWDPRHFPRQALLIKAGRAPSPYQSRLGVLSERSSGLLQKWRACTWIWDSGVRST